MSKNLASNSVGINYVYIYYYNKKIEYKYNSWGYRTKEFKDLEDDYILIFGCSFTEGIGLYYDDMWATKLSKELKLDVFNIGMGGTGVDFQFYNTTLIHNHIIKNNKRDEFYRLFEKIISDNLDNLLAILSAKPEPLLTAGILCDLCMVLLYGFLPVVFI